MIDKDWIAERIRAEYRKYGKTLPDEWADIAAIKIRNGIKEREE